MGRQILLDTGILGLLCLNPTRPEVQPCYEWLRAQSRAGTEVKICELNDFEIRRELIRLGATTKLRRLDDLCSTLEIVPVNRRAWLKAAEFWALVRRAGLPTADLKVLDADVILAGVAATIGGLGDEVVIAPSNVKHLGRFPGVDTRAWAAIA